MQNHVMARKDCGNPPLLGITVLRQYEYTRQIAVGFAQYCAEHQLGLRTFFSRAGEWDFAPAKRLDGLAVFTTTKRALESAMRRAGHVLNFSSANPTSAVPRVVSDHGAIGRLGADHLVGQGFRRLAFLSSPTWFGEQRRAGFEQALRDRDDVSIGGDVPETLQHADLVRWLAQQSAPLGVMADNDLNAVNLIAAAAEAGWQVPGQLAVVGVDNDQPLCLGTIPTLTSVDPQADLIGYVLAETLVSMIRGEAAANQTLIAPRGVVSRGSTRQPALDDHLVDQAMSFIGQDVAGGINVEDVAVALSVSRRTLERRFKQVAGRTVASAIRQTRVDRAKQLLLDTDLPMHRIAAASGFGSDRQMRLAFAAVEKQSPSAVRQWGGDPHLRFAQRRKGVEQEKGTGSILFGTALACH